MKRFARELYWVLMYLAVVAFVIVNLAEGQCIDGRCPTPQWRPSTPTVQSYVPQRGQYPAVVAVHFLQGNDRSIGSGTIVNVASGIAEVLTCAHDYTAQKAVLVITQDGRQWKASVKGVDKIQDVLLLAIKDPGIKPMVLSGVSVEKFNKVFVCGYAQGRLWKGSWSRVTQRVSPTKDGPFTWFEVGCPSEQGMSGGPIVNERGRIAGLITGTDGSITTGPCLSRVRAVLRFALPPYLNRPGAIIPKPRPTIRPRASLVPVKPTTPKPAPQVVSQQPAACRQCGALEARVKRLEELAAALKLEADTTGASEARLESLEGRIADWEPTPVPDVSPLYERLESLEASVEQPITVRVVKNGEVLEEEKIYLGGVLPLRLVPIGSAN